MQCVSRYYLHADVYVYVCTCVCVCGRVCIFLGGDRIMLNFIIVIIVEACMKGVSQDTISSPQCVCDDIISSPQ